MPMLLVLLALASPSWAKTDATAPATSTDWRDADAGVDHRLTLPSAQTLRQGQVALNDYPSTSWSAHARGGG